MTFSCHTPYHHHNYPVIWKVPVIGPAVVTGPRAVLPRYRVRFLSGAKDVFCMAPSPEVGTHATFYPNVPGADCLRQSGRNMKLAVPFHAVPRLRICGYIYRVFYIFLVLSCPFYIWCYSPFRASASLMRRLHSSLFSALFLNPRIHSSCNASLWTTSAHLILGLPTGLVV